MDALDNFYVLISGNKKFRIISPNYAPILRTISPTYAVLNNGFSFQYSFMTPLSEEQKESLLATSSMTDVGGDNSIINQLITGESYEYDTNTVKFYHFSSVDDIQVGYD